MTFVFWDDFLLELPPLPIAPAVPPTNGCEDDMRVSSDANPGIRILLFLSDRGVDSEHGSFALICIAYSTYLDAIEDL